MNFSKLPRWARILIILLVLIIILLLIFRCRWCCRPGKNPLVKGYPTQIIVWENPDSPNASFKTWLGKFKDTIRAYGEITDSASCLNCDSTLLLLSGPGPQIFIQQSGSGGSGGSKVPAPGGGDGPAFYCANLDIGVPDRSVDSPALIMFENRFKLIYPYMNVNSSPTPSGEGNKVTVAVFDTGDTTKDPFVSGIAHSCLLDTQSRYGWNFFSNNSNTRDDHAARHGTAVTRFIVDQVAQYSGRTMTSQGGGVNILPVKIFDNTGRGTLYGLLCGVAYAANSGAQLINASLGFYKYADTANNEVAAVLLENYLQYYLVKNNILMVAAAGNANHTADSLYQAQSGNTSGDPRFLDSNQFYPAFLVKDSLLKNNLLVVTTVSIWKGQVSPLQNYSDSIVDVGVNCDTVLNSYYSFINLSQPFGVTTSPITGEKVYTIHTVTGSSFATPIVTGKIAAYYSGLVGNNPIIKDSILRRLERLAPYKTTLHQDSLLSPNPGFKGKIRNGVTGAQYP